MKLTLESRIEALLFWKAEPMSHRKLAEILNVSLDEVKKAVTNLHTQLTGRGVAIVENGDEVTMGTNKEISPLIEALTKEELMKDLGKAGLETLSIILYQAPISRAEIDYVRGVNSQFIIRNLLVRGLIEKVDNPKDQRIFLYKPTLDLLSHLGISKVTDIPDYEKVRIDIENFKKTNHDNEGSQN